MWSGLAAAIVILLVGSYLVANHLGGTTQSGGSATVEAEALTDCTVSAADAASASKALEAAKPGDRICLNGDLGGQELLLRASGADEQPITVLGGGKANTGQITVRGDHVVIDGVRMTKPRSPGFMLVGNDITVRASVVDGPQVVKKGDDGDGIRFFGNDIKIVNNLIRNVVNLNGQKGNHADAIQTFATSEEEGPSQRVLVNGNRFEKIDNMCLIAEGPDSEEGDGLGEGESGQFTVTDNYCDNGAGQAFFFDDITGVTLTGNTVVGTIDKAFALQNNSTGATIRDNEVGPKVGFEVGMDDSSEEDYTGPKPGGAP
ncbi:right-handed parallel beta-helix repeat-containing protein [Pseudonocardia spinosispora]|uniref:right-handed parallel beta-helix repeat-containing protein n=1 Tax=Pseudonocardia spinosispora TaxID=103441 RepID=UPI00041874E5|nr:right-handed parallel beta-helix repeat-containing protein [Pseudonocardia spinosispora]